ncbi:MAG: alpha/beta hydrolase [bacterium]|nr:alpha/beta hydrolase [bacterium]
MSKKYFESLHHDFLLLKNGSKISFYTEKSSKKPLAVLIHGFGGNAYGMNFLAQKMSKKWRVLLFEMPNHGKSDFSKIENTAVFQEITDQIIAKIEEKFGKISLVVCHSISCCAISENVSSRISSALITPVFATSPAYNFGAELLFRSKIFALISNFWLWSPIKATFLIRNWHKKSVRNVFENMLHSQPSFRQIIAQAKMSKIVLEKPLLRESSKNIKFLIIGGRDGMSEKLSENQREMFFPNAQIHTLKTGHLLPLEIPEKVAEILQN